MKLENMKRCLLWLIEYLQKNKPRTLKNLEKINSRWTQLDNLSVEVWVEKWGNTRTGASMRIEEVFIELNKISKEDCSCTDAVTKPTVRAMADLMGIVKNNQNIFKKDLENLIDQKLDELHIPYVG